MEAVPRGILAQHRAIVEDQLTHQPVGAQIVDPDLDHDRHVNPNAPEALVSGALKDNTAPDTAADTGGHVLAVMYFENIVDRDDPDRLGEIATNLLITGLSESESIRVLSSQRAYDILRSLGKDNIKSIDRETATEIANRAGAGTMLLGSIP